MFWRVGKLKIRIIFDFWRYNLEIVKVLYIFFVKLYRIYCKLDQNWLNWVWCWNFVGRMRVLLIYELCRIWNYVKKNIDNFKGLAAEIFFYFYWSCSGCTWKRQIFYLIMVLEVDGYKYLWLNNWIKGSKIIFNLKVWKKADIEMKI